MLARLTRYFISRYPKRSSPASGTVFRVGESERLRIAREFFGPTCGLHVLDVGCGDGQFLADVLQGRPASLTLLDLSPHNLAAAEAVLREQCDDVTAVAGDFRAVLPDRQFDLILVVGVLDYWPNWKPMLKQLAAVAPGRLLISVPPIGVPRHWLRRIWLAFHGVRLQTVSRQELDRALSASGLEGKLLRTSYEWFACVRAAERADAT